VAIDNFESINFSNKAALTINALGGDDTISLNNPNTPTLLTGITVDGGDPTASDTLIVNGTTGIDTVGIDQLTSDGARVTGLGPTINIATAEHLIYNGQGGNDNITVTTPVGPDVISFLPGSSFASADISMSQRLPLSYTNVSTLGSVSFADAGGGRADTLQDYGRSVNDVFRVGSGGVIITNDLGSGSRFALDINTAGIARLELLGLAGDDRFTVAGNPAFTSVLVEGGDASGSDLLEVDGTGASETIPVALDFSFVQVVGAETVFYSGIESLVVGGGGGAATDTFSVSGVGGPSGGLKTVSLSATTGSVLIVAGTVGDDTINVTPTAAGAGSPTPWWWGPGMSSFPPG
jgi:hypothetical protein